MPESVWLEMENARVESGALEIQIKGDRTEKERSWWPVTNTNVIGDNVHAALRSLFESLEKKRVVLVQLKVEGGALKCTGIRIQYSESERR